MLWITLLNYDYVRSVLCVGFYIDDHTLYSCRDKKEQSKMKTAKQWAIRIQNSKEPWEKLVSYIQVDALNEAIISCQNEHLENDHITPQTDDDIAYDSGINDCIVSIISICDSLIPNQGPISIECNTIKI